MFINGLDHINIETVRLRETADFYAHAFDLVERDPPPNLDREKVRWMFDASERAIFHLSTAGSLIGADTGGPRDESGSGAVHHVALDCKGFDAMVERLTQLGLEHRCNDLSQVGLKQIFVQDPNGVLIECNFRAVNFD